MVSGLLNDDSMQDPMDVTRMARTLYYRNLDHIGVTRENLPCCWSRMGEWGVQEKKCYQLFLRVAGDFR